MRSKAAKSCAEYPVFTMDCEIFLRAALRHCAATTSGIVIALAPTSDKVRDHRAVSGTPRECPSAALGRPPCHFSFEPYPRLSRLMAKGRGQITALGPRALPFLRPPGRLR